MLLCSVLCGIRPLHVRATCVLCLGSSLADILIGLAQKTQIVTAAVAKTHLSQTSMENGKGIADWLKTVKISGMLWSSVRSNQISRSDVLDVVDCTNVLTSSILYFCAPYCRTAVQNCIAQKQRSV